MLKDAEGSESFFSSMPYHIISRGNNRERVFRDDEDFEKYLEICRRYKMTMNVTMGA
jgi:REP element-mobilizing transposase RayT